MGIHFGWSQTLEDKIDSLFTGWNIPNHPGGTVGVMKTGNIVFTEAYGLASLEYLIPNNKKTLFNVGSISKQFTAMGIVLLEQQGRLSFDDDVHEFLPELPNFGHRITIRHLLHHTSGLRSFHDLLGLAGWRGDDNRSNSDLMQLLKQQKNLNFSPGESFSYCNSGYILLAEIIESITGQDFKTWMENSVFLPLGMTSTFVEDNYQRIVTNRATSYYHSHDNVYEMAQGYWAYTGAGNVYSTANDLLKWSQNFYAPNNGWKEAFITIQTLDPLNDGSDSNYAFGLFIDEKFGQKRIQHAGVVGGFRAFLSIYPDEALSIVVLTNFSNARFGEKADAVANILLENKITAPEPLCDKPFQESNSNMTTQDLSVYTGQFYSPELKTHYSILLKGDALQWYQTRHGSHKMILTEEDVFKSDWPVERIKFSRNKAGEIVGLYISNGRVHNLWLEKL